MCCFYWQDTLIFLLPPLWERFSTLAVFKALWTLVFQNLPNSLWVGVWAPYKGLLKICLWVPTPSHRVWLEDCGKPYLKPATPPVTQFTTRGDTRGRITLATRVWIRLRGYPQKILLRPSVICLMSRLNLWQQRCEPKSETTKKIKTNVWCLFVEGCLRWFFALYHAKSSLNNYFGDCAFTFSNHRRVAKSKLNKNISRSRSSRRRWKHKDVGKTLNDPARRCEFGPHKYLLSDQEMWVDGGFKLTPVLTL